MIRKRAGFSGMQTSEYASFGRPRYVGMAERATLKKAGFPGKQIYKQVADVYLRMENFQYGPTREC